MNKSVLNTITFHLEANNNKEVDFNGETMTFTLQLIKIWVIKWAFKKWKVTVIALIENTTLAQKKTLLVG